jgi:hypothetical protein
MLHVRVEAVLAGTDAALPLVSVLIPRIHDKRIHRIFNPQSATRRAGSTADAWTSVHGLC